MQIRHSVALIASLVMFSTPRNAILFADLKEDLIALDLMRKGLETPLDEVEARGTQLLQEYDAPEERALIYYQLAHVHAQSGLTQPDKIIQHGEAALNLPLPPANRLQLYIYIGDATKLINRSLANEDQLSFEEIRRQATKLYIEGLVESVKYKLPDEKPPRATRGPLQMVLGDPDDPEYHRRAEEYRQENRDFEKRRDQSDHDRTAWENRRILYDQIAYLYLRQPAADEELRGVAISTLPAEMSEKLLARFEELSPSMRQPEIQSLQTASADEAPAQGNQFKWLIVLNVILLIALIIFFWIRRAKQTR